MDSTLGISNNLHVADHLHNKYREILYIKNFSETGLIEKSPSKTIINLGCGFDYFSGEEEGVSFLEEAGINKYIGIDYDMDGEDFTDDLSELGNKDGVSWTKRNGVDVLFVRAEILKALHSMSDNFGNVFMTGLDISIFRLSNDWTFAVIAELKRVIPENGFFFTDEYGPLMDVLWKAVPDYKERIQEVNEDDPYFAKGNGEDKNSYLYQLGKYVIDFPEIGFRIYTKSKSWSDTIIAINTNKTRPE